MHSLDQVWAIVPARGGSVGIPRKNLRLLGGKPLIAHVIGTTLEVLPHNRVVVITDDSEIASVGRRDNVVILLEEEVTPAAETLDAKVLRNIPRLKELGAAGEDLIITLQPTSPLLTSASLRQVIKTFDDPETKSLLTVVDDRHLRWKIGEAGHIIPAYAERSNRQQLPSEYRETGGIIAARLSDIEKHKTRVIEPIAVIELDPDEAIDIDTYADLFAAAHLITRKRIAIRVDASHALGMGHAYRMLAFASELARHKITIYIARDQSLAMDFFARYPYPVRLVADHEDFCAQVASERPDLIALDILDTTQHLVHGIREAAPNAKIITFEDAGTGSQSADLLVAEFIDVPAVPASRKLTGIEHALLAPSFDLLSPSLPAGGAVEEILILFGGTDPSGLALKSVRSLRRIGYSGHVTIARGLGAVPIDLDQAEFPFKITVLHDVRDMATLMSKMDLAFTSAGRTVVELISRGIPSICLSQNTKELTHTHAKEDNGVLALGLGSQVTEVELDGAVTNLISDTVMRAHYAENAKRAGSRRSNKKTITRIMEKVGFGDLLEI